MGIAKKEKEQRRPMGMRAAAFIQFSSKYINVAVHLIVTMVLARILIPEDYGIMAVVSVFLGLFNVLSTAGVGAAVVQFRELTDEDCGGLLIFTAGFGIVLSLVFCGASLPVSIIYGSNDFIPLMCLASIAVFLNSANMVPNGLLLRDKHFIAIGVRLILTSLVAGTIAVALALMGWGAYALVWNTIIQSALNLLWNLIASRPVLRGVHPIQAIRKVLSFSAFQFGSSVLQYLIRNLDNMIVGFAMGVTALGYYDKAYKLAKYPIEIIPSTLNPVLGPYFADFETNRDGLWGMFIKVEKVYSVAGVLLTVLCTSCARELINICFGDRWEASILSFAILSLSIVFQMMNYLVFAVLQGLRRTDLLLAHTGITGIAMLVLLLGGVYVGTIEAVAAAISLYFAVVSTASFLWFVVHTAFERSMLEYLKLYAPEFACGLVALLAVTLIAPILPSNDFLSLAAKTLVCTCVYLLLIWRCGQLSHLSMLLPSRFRPMKATRRDQQ